MTDAKIKRINELAKKAKTEKLSEDELKEQQQLRREYIDEIKADLRSQLQNIEIVDKDKPIN